MHISVRYKFTRWSTEKKTALALSVRFIHLLSVRPSITRVGSPSICPSVTNSHGDRQKKRPLSLCPSVRRLSVRPSQGCAVRPYVRPSQIHAVIDRKKRPLSLCPSDRRPSVRPSVTKVGTARPSVPSIRHKFTRWSTERDDKYLLELP